MKSLTLPSQFKFVDLIALARRGKFDPQIFLEPLDLDLKNLEFAGVCAMAGIKALIAWGQHKQPPGCCLNLQHQNQSAVQYLSYLDFFTPEIYWCQTPPAEVGQRGTADGRFFRIRCLRDQWETAGVAGDLLNCFQLRKSPAGETIRYGVSELVDNALQHSECPTGTYVAAQYFPRLNTINTVIADTGVGIRAHLSRHPNYRGLADDLEALRIALTPNVTGSYISSAGEANQQNAYENQGIGLSVTNHIAKKSGGVLYVWSGTALYRSNAGLERMPVAWPGTVVFLSLPSGVAVDYMGIISEIHIPLRKRRIKLHFDT